MGKFKTGNVSHEIVIELLIVPINVFELSFKSRA